MKTLITSKQSLTFNNTGGRPLDFSGGRAKKQTKTICTHSLKKVYPYDNIEQYIVESAKLLCPLIPPPQLHKVKWSTTGRVKCLLIASKMDKCIDHTLSVPVLTMVTHLLSMIIICKSISLLQKWELTLGVKGT